MINKKDILTLLSTVNLELEKQDRKLNLDVLENNGKHRYRFCRVSGYPVSDCLTNLEAFAYLQGCHCMLYIISY